MLYNHVRNAWKEAILAYNTAEASKDTTAVEMLLPAVIHLSQLLQHIEARREAMLSGAVRVMTNREYDDMMLARLSVPDFALNEKPALKESPQ